MKMKELLKNESGVFLIVEAAIIYPIMLVMIMTLLFISMMLTMKANMQSALETSLMYYRTELTDSYIAFADEKDYHAGGKNGLRNAQYTAESDPPSAYSNIYTKTFGRLTGQAEEGRFREIFFDNYRFLNFSSGESGGALNSEGITVTLDSTANFVIYRELNAKAVQKIHLPLINGMFGIDNSITLKADAKIVVSDSVSVMRITDVVDYVVIKTGFDKKLDDVFRKNIQKFLDFIKG